MTNPEKNTATSLAKPPFAVTVIAIIAVLIASYLVWHSLNTGSKLAGCGGEGAGCDEVLDTKWGSWLGMPVSAGGLLVYAGILVLSLSMRKEATALKWSALLCLAVLAAASGLWFIGLQTFVVKSYCWYCMTVHACGLVIAILTLKSVPGVTETLEKKKRTRVEGLSVKQRTLAVATALLGVAVLAAGQAWNRPVDMPGTAQLAAPVTPPQQGPSTTQASPNAEVGRNALLAKGAFRFTMGEFPIFGSPDAQNIVAHFFDFTCPACREFHPSLMAAQQPNENTTALVMIPIPLDAVCNSAVKETSYGHMNACEYARLGLAIWNTRPDVYYMYDQFIFEGQYPPPPGAARTFADQLVGADRMIAALQDPKIDQALQLGLSMFYSPSFTNKAIPALVTEDNIVVGIQPPPLLNTIFAGQPARQ